MTLNNATTGEQITEFCWATTQSNVNQFTATALDGSVYIQVIGSPSQTIIAECVIATGMKSVLESAHANVDLMFLSDGSETIHGRIIELEFQVDVRGGKQRCTIKLAREEV